MKNRYFLLFALFILPFAVNAQFVENRGQFSHREISKLRPDIQYQLTGSKVISYFLNDGIENYYYKTRDAARENWSEDLINDEEMGYEIRVPQDIFFYRFDIRFLDSNDEMQLVPVDKNKTYRNYYYEFCPDGILFVPDYKSIEYQNIYDNIDLRYLSRDGQVKYEFVLYPDAVVSDIKMQYRGVENLRINDNGDLIYDIAGEEMIEEKPYTFYTVGGEEIESRYVIEEDNTVSFILDGVDEIGRSVIIDPVLTWSTYFQGVYGGYQYNPGVDDDGNIFICTQDGSGTLPVLNEGSGQWYQGSEVGPSPNWDLAIFRFNNDLSLAWCTYYGGMGCEEGWGRRNVAVDNDNNRVYFSGETDTPYSNSVQTFPTYDPGSGAFYQDVSYDCGASYPFFIQMTPDGVREWATLFTYETGPFSGCMGTDVESIYYKNGYVYFAGETNKYSHSGIPLRTLSGAYNNSFYCGGNVPYVGRFDVNRGLDWCTYINNNIATSSFSCNCVDMVVDESNNIFVLNSYSEYSGSGISNLLPLVSPGGGAYYQSTAASFGTSRRGNHLVKLNPSSSSVLWGTFIQGSTYSGSWPDFASCLALDGSGNLFMGFRGMYSSNFPVTFLSGAYNQSTRNSTTGGDGGLVKFSSAGAKLWGTYLNGSSHPTTTTAVNDIDVYPDNTFIIIGNTACSDFPIVNLSGSYNKSTITSPGTIEGFISKFGTDCAMDWSTYFPIGYGYGAVTSTDCDVRYVVDNSGGSNVPLVDPGSPAYYSSTVQNYQSFQLFEDETAVASVAASSINASATSICVGSSVTLSVNGGSLGTGASWNWYSGSCGGTLIGTGSSIVVSPSSNTTYYVRAEGDCDVSGCVSRPITVNTIPTVSASASPTTVCVGSSTTLTGSGASTYNWSSGGSGTTTSVSPSSNTTYTVTGTSNGCTNTANVSVAVTPLPTVSASATVSPICNGSSTTISASGASTYSWSNSLGSNSSYSVSPSSNTTYTVTGTSSGCSNTANVTVTVNSLPSVSASASPTSICNGSSTTLSGSGANTYNWSSGGSGTSVSVSPSSNTTYTVTGTNTTTGCSNTAQVSVTVNSLPSVSASASPTTICDGSSTTLSGSGANTYSWSSGGSGTSVSVSPSSNTTYTVTGTSNGCTNTANVSVAVTPLPTVSASATVSPICNGSSTTISASGASTYSWSNSLGSNTAYSVSPGSTTTYTVTGTSSGCSNTANVTVTVIDLPTVSTSVTVSPICAGNNTTISASGASTYNWSNSLGTNSSYSVSPGSTTTYTVTGTTSGCSNTANITVNVNPLPNVSASATYPTICPGENTDISASGASTYIWTTLGSGASHNVSPSSTTTYYVTGTDGSSCTNTASVTVTVGSTPAVVASAGDTTLCLGSTTTINATGAANYFWDQSLGAGSSHIISPTITTVYTVTGSTASGCTNTANVTVIVNPVPGDPTALATPSPICLGDSSLITASGGGTGLTYVVYDAPVGGTDLGNTGLTVYPTTTTVYYVAAVNSYGCENTGGREPITIIVNPLPTIPVVSASDTNICEGETVALIAGGSGTGVVYEVWTDTTGGSMIGYAPMMVSPTNDSIYYIQAVTASGCANPGGMVPFEIFVTPVLDAAMNAVGPFCIYDSVAMLTAVNGGGAWSGTGITDTTLGYFDPSVAGIGTHNVMYTTTGVCPDTDTMQIVVTDVLDATISNSGPYCLSDPADTLTAANSGGLWSGTGITDISNGIFDPSVAGVGTHEIIYSTSGSCSDTDTAYFVVQEQMDATIAASGPYCDNEAGTLLIAADPGGTWSGNGILNNVSGLFDPVSAGEGTHTIYYSIPGACGDIDSTDIIVFEAPVMQVTETDESCTGNGDGIVNIIVTGGTTPYSYLWSNGDTTSNLSNLTEGTYYVTVSDASSCSDVGMGILYDPNIECDGVIPHAVVPNAFSPNNDGENDVLYVRGEGIASLVFVVYDRWGEKVFETQDENIGWDGTFRGQKLDPGVFAYYLRVIFVDATEKIEKGDITLVR